MMGPPKTFEIDIQGQGMDTEEETTRIDTTMPAGLEKHLTEAQWNHFCSQINSALQEYSNSKVHASYLNWALYMIVGLLCVVVILLATTGDTATTEEQDVAGQQQNWQDDFSTCELDDGCNSNTAAQTATAARHLAPILIVLPLFVVMATVAGKWSLRSAHDDSLNKVRQVCWEFSNTKPNMMVQLLTRYLEVPSRRRPGIRRILYIEFWFSARDRYPLSSSHGDRNSSFSSLVYEPPNHPVSPIEYAAERTAQNENENAKTNTPAPSFTSTIDTVKDCEMV